MRDFYYHILRYKEIHPIRFWIILLVLLLVFISLLYLIRYLFLTNKKNTKVLKEENEVGITKSNVQDESTEMLVSQKEGTEILKNYKILHIALIIQFVIIIALVVALSLNYNSIFPKIENVSISSSEYIFGIDVSHYQGRINWGEMRTSHHPIEYVFIRATMGIDDKDIEFDRNWKNAKDYNYIRGAYHYYRPNENSTKQFENFKSVVKIEDGDFVPILDVEKESKYGRDNLREGVMNWLKLAEKEYGVKPMLYTGFTFYKHVLDGYVDDYPLWIAAYSGKHRLNGVKWRFHQFTENVRVKGVKPTVDGNDFKGDITELRGMLKKSDTIPLN